MAKQLCLSACQTYAAARWHASLVCQLVGHYRILCLAKQVAPCNACETLSDMAVAPTVCCCQCFDVYNGSALPTASENAADGVRHDAGGNAGGSDTNHPKCCRVCQCCCSKQACWLLRKFCFARAVACLKIILYSSLCDCLPDLLFVFKLPHILHATRSTRIQSQHVCLHLCCCTLHFICSP